MENLYLTVIFLFTLFFLLGSGVWIGLALMGVAYVGMEMFTVRPAGDAMITTIWTTSSSWSLTALPLFIWVYIFCSSFRIICSYINHSWKNVRTRTKKEKVS